MKKKFICVSISFLIVTAAVLTSCSTSTTAAPSTSPQATISSAVVTSTQPKTTSTNAATTKPTSASTSSTGNWWDTFGTPTYGGTMIIRLNKNIDGFDPYSSSSMTVENGWLENLHGDIWTLNPTVFAYKLVFRPSDYVIGNLAQSWEFTDPSTYVVHLRQGILWQNIPPVNGRGFTSSDVVFHYDRIFGLGSSFTPSPFYATNANWLQLISVTAPDKYTVVFKWKTPNPELITETIQSPSAVSNIEAQEAVQQWGNLSDWHHAIGTGPFILNDFVSGSSATLIKNANYWGYDERYPQNKLPYIDTLKFLIIPDNATALAAVRTHKIDVIDKIAIQDAQSMLKTNHEILQLTLPLAQAVTIDPRVDKTPFNDIKVREAMQLAIDLPTIAQTYYGGTVSAYPCTLTSYDLKGWGFPYDQWPQDLKDEYSYNPTKAKQLLADAGYPTGFKTNLLADNASDMGLLQIVQSYFTRVGIDMSIQVMDSVTWTSFVQTNHKNDALVTRPAGSLGQANEPTGQLTRFQTGYGNNWGMVSDATFDSFFTQAMAATSVAQVKQILTNANEHVTQQHFVISLLQPTNFVLYQPWLKGYNGQNESISGGGGPLLDGFYLARFWIDQDLKQSMGY